MSAKQTNVTPSPAAMSNTPYNPFLKRSNSAPAPNSAIPIAQWTPRNAEAMPRAMQAEKPTKGRFCTKFIISYAQRQSFRGQDNLREDLRGLFQKPHPVAVRGEMGDYQPLYPGFLGQTRAMGRSHMRLFRRPLFH